MMNKIPCLVLAYYDFESIRTTVDCLSKQTDRLDLIVAENPSEFTNSRIKPYLLESVQSGAVSQYFLFDTNITNNALEVIMDSGYIPLAYSEYVLVTDGDLLIQDDDWLNEQIRILDRHKEVFACAIRLDPSNLPVHTFPESPGWLPPVWSETDLYAEVPTGMHLVLMRTADLMSFMRYRQKHHLKFRDNVLFDYCYHILRKKWVRTRRGTARHLTWDHYGDLNHPYTKLKLSRSLQEIWAHDSYSTFERHARPGPGQRLSAPPVPRVGPLQRARELWTHPGKWPSTIAGKG
jgi:hypothetical protein